MSQGVGRTREYSRGYNVPIPDEFAIPTCMRCGEIYIVPELEDTLYPILEERFLKMQAEHYRKLVEILVRRHGVKHRDIVRACGVTPAYMSHVLNGKRAASTTLTRLLEAFVVCDSEFVRHLEGRHWSAIKLGPYDVKVAQTREATWRDTDEDPKSSVRKSSRRWLANDNDLEGDQTAEPLGEVG